MFFSDARRVMLATVLAVAAVKLVMLILVGPGFQPDTRGYMDYARIMLSGTGWLHGLDHPDAFIPITEFRTIGYPALMAASMVLAPHSWAVLLVLMQIAVSSVAAALTFGLASRLGLNPVWSAVAVVAGGTSVSLVTDLQILTDSLNASLFLSIVAILLNGALDRRPLGIGAALGLGVLYLCAFLLREGNAILAVLLLIPLAVRVAAAPCGTRPLSALAALLVFVPLAAGHQAYSAWNEARTGEAFVTTSGQTVYLQGVVLAVPYAPAILAGDGAMERAGRDIFSDHDFSEVLEVLSRLHGEGHSGPQRAAMAKALYWQAWARHPDAMARKVADTLGPWLASVAVRPVSAILDATAWNTGTRPFPPLEQLLRGGWGAAGMLVAGLNGAERAASLVLTLGFVVAPPLLFAVAVRGRCRNAPPEPSPSELRTWATFALWLLVLGYLAAHAVVHLETRYLAPVVPLLAPVGLRAVLIIPAWCRSRSSCSRPGGEAARR